MKEEYVSTIKELVSSLMGSGKWEIISFVREFDDGWIWMGFCGNEAFLGENIQDALRTAKRGDWWIPALDGPLSNTERVNIRARLSLPLEGSSKWSTIQQRNLQKAQEFCSILRNSMETAQKVFANEKDPGEKLEPGDLELIIKLRNQAIPTPMGIIKLHKFQVEMAKPSWWGRLFSYQKYPATLSDYYVQNKEDGKWVAVGIRIKPDGWTMSKGPIWVNEHSLKGKFIEAGELIYETETKNLLNLRLYDQNGNLLRLVGDGNGGIKLYELDYRF